MIEMDDKYKRFQLRQQSVTGLICLNATHFAIESVSVSEYVYFGIYVIRLWVVFSSDFITSVPTNERAVRFNHYQWLILAVVIVVMFGTYGALYHKRFKTEMKTVDQDEADSLLVGYGSTHKWKRTFHALQWHCDLPKCLISRQFYHTVSRTFFEYFAYDLTCWW